MIPVIIDLIADAVAEQVAARVAAGAITRQVVGGAVKKVSQNGMYVATAGLDDDDDADETERRRLQPGGRKWRSDE
jgi:hypothetical protein